MNARRLAGTVDRGRRGAAFRNRQPGANRRREHSGPITDFNGAAVRNAVVEVRNVGTGVTHSAVTDAEGRYRAPLLPSGDYEVRVTASGFQPLLREAFPLAVGQDAIVD